MLIYLFKRKAYQAMKNNEDSWIHIIMGKTWVWKSTYYKNVRWYFFPCKPPHFFSECFRLYLFHPKNCNAVGTWPAWPGICSAPYLCESWHRRFSKMSTAGAVWSAHDKRVCPLPTGEDEPSAQAYSPALFCTTVGLHRKCSWNSRTNSSTQTLNFRYRVLFLQKSLFFWGVLQHLANLLSLCHLDDKVPVLVIDDWSPLRVIKV